MPAFRHRGVRELFQQVNTLAMLLAAHQRLSYLKGLVSRLPISAEVLTTCTLLEDIAEDVYFAPVPGPGSEGAFIRIREQEAMESERTRFM
jgi:hypothetical protein